MLWFFKYFCKKNSAKKLAFLTQNKAKLCKILIITFVFEKNAILFAENCQKSQKIVIITSTQEVLVFSPQLRSVWYCVTRSNKSHKLVHSKLNCKTFLFLISFASYELFKHCYSLNLAPD
jgi:hypothetical protein